MGALLGVTALTNGSTGGWILDPFTALDDYESPTLIRLLVSIVVRTASSPTANDLFGFGIYVATGDEDTTQLPLPVWDPLTDPSSDWAYRFIAPQPVGTAAGQLASNGGADIVIDVRTKRKIPRGAGILGVFSATGTAGAGTGSYSAAADVRALLISG